MDLATLLNACSEIEFEGKAYRLRQPTLLEEAEFQRYLEQAAHDSIERRTYAEPEQREKAHNSLTRDCAEGYYEAGSEGYVRAVSNPKRLPRLIAIICREQGMTPAIAERMVAAEMKKIAAALVSRSTSDPNLIRAVLATLGLPEDWQSSLSQTHPSASGSTPSADSANNNCSPSTPSSGTAEAPPG